MALRVLEELEAVYLEVLEILPAKFDSHDFIRRLAHTNQRLYIQALHYYIESDSPFMNVHREIIRTLAKRDDLVQKIGTQNSEDIFKQVNSATVWVNLLN